MNKLTAKALLSSGILVSAIIGVGLISTAASAQSFSCARAEIPSEMAICNNENLLIKDERLASLFADALVKATQTNKVQRVSAEQSLWLKRRNDCQVDFSCLEKEYDQRIQVLNQSRL